MGFEVMFHVSTLLPFDPKDEQHLQRKSKIGNDFACIIFQEKGCHFRPPTLTSHMLFLFVIV